jgi:hypothetical protein
MSLLKKLRIDTEKPLWLLNAPEDCRHLFEEIEDIKTSTAGKTPIEQLVLFAEDSLKLNALADKVADRVPLNAIMWVCYPKKGSKLEADLHRDKVWDHLFTTFEGVASAAIDETWSGMRFKKKDPNKPGTWIPMEERKTEGIDYINRTVTLPADALKAMKPYKGLADFFYSMSFSHTREYIEAIVEARKPETRQRRIEGMITKVLALKEAKGAKAAAKKK